MMSKKASNTAKSSQSPRVKKPRGKGVPFKRKNPITGENDPRINVTGQNAKFTEVRHIAQKIFDEKVRIGRQDENGKIVVTGEINKLENMLRLWIDSHDYKKQNKALEWGFGKVPDEMIVHSQEVEQFIQSNIDLFTDGQISRIASGEDPWVVIGELLREVAKQKQKVE